MTDNLWSAGLPETVKVGFRVYTICLMDHWESSKEGAFGQCLNNEAIIRLDKHMDTHKAVNTLVHELFHACWFLWSIGSENLTEESVVARLANGFATVLVDNLALLDWFNACLRPCIVRLEEADR